MTDVTLILCPECGAEFPMSEALDHQLQAAAAQQAAVLVQQQRSSLQKEAIEQVQQLTAFEITDLKNQISERDTLLSQFQANELALRQRERNLEAEKANLKFEAARQIDLERTQIRAEVAAQLTDQHRLKQAEWDRERMDFVRKLDELNRKVEQGSQKTQGDVLQTEIFGLLKDFFPNDALTYVSNGVHGADINHVIRNEKGETCGKILWESKNAKAWGSTWIQKLKDDLQREKADVGVIVSTILPGDQKLIAWKDGVGIAHFSALVGFAQTIRHSLVRLHQAQLTSELRGEKMGLIYEYVSGPRFHQRLGAVQDVASVMKRELEAERRTTENTFTKREKHLNRIMQAANLLHTEVDTILETASAPTGGLEILAHNDEAA